MGVLHLAQVCKEVETVEQSYYRWRKIYGGMSLKGFSSVKFDQARTYKDLELGRVTQLESAA